MIYVTQGHESSIALEVFLKSFSLLLPEEKKNFSLLVNKQALEKNLTLLKIPYPKDLNISWVKKGIRPLSTLALEAALDKIRPQDQLLTLPTSKDQLVLNKKNKLGYTEFFRAFYKNKNISMCFRAESENLLLITDHIPLQQVSRQITKDLVYAKAEITIESFEHFFSSIQQIIFAGINPHAGENGLLGKEDRRLPLAIKKLRKKFPEKIFSGPFAGDTLHFYKNEAISQLFIYMFHDQGLPLFKSKYGLKGLNITFGLPFLRMSVDHGTAFDLFGKNLADPAGCHYLLKEALLINKRMRNAY